MVKVAPPFRAARAGLKPGAKFKFGQHRHCAKIPPPKLRVSDGCERPMKTQAQLAESIQRFQESFWDRKSTGRPPVGIYDEDIFLPIKFLRRPFTRLTVTPEEINGDLVVGEYEFSFAHRAVTCDDYMPFSSAWRGIPWLEAACGCPVRYADGSLAPGHFVSAVDDLSKLTLSAPNAWLDCLRRETERIQAQAAPDCWVSPSILRGPSDALAAIRGMTEFFLDLHDSPQAVERAARVLNHVLITEMDIHYSIVKPKLGGFVQILGYWAPAKTFMLQEDALGMCAPSVYRDIFMQFNAAIVEHLGPHVLFHFHSTGFAHHPHVMDIPGIAGVQMTMETIGPTLADMIPFFQKVLARTRLILQVCTGFEYLPEVLRKIPHEGLYLIIPSKYIPTDQAFRDFVAAHWKC